MSCAVRSQPDATAAEFMAIADRHAERLNLPTYSELVRAVHEQDQRASEFYGALRQTGDIVGELQLLLARTGLDQPDAILELTLEEALEKANNTPYGLSAGVWTEKGSRILWMAERLRDGVVWANTYNRFDPASPFGGYKESGFGREGGRHGLEAYLTFE